MPMTGDALRIRAEAKINLSLEVIGRRDDGYHEVATILQTIDLADTVTISRYEGRRDKSRRDEGLTVTCDVPELSGEGNLAWAAAVALAEYAGVAPDAHIAITKRIPVAAGLGGGSADAAAALRGLNRLWGLRLPRAALAEIAATLGSDVPFLLTGGAAFGSGRGDELEPIVGVDATELLLVVPTASIPGKTPTLYGSLTPDDFTDGEYTRGLGRRNDAATAFTSRLGRNAFQRPARAIFPGLSDVWNTVAGITAFPPCLSGAGPAFFCMPSNRQERDRVAAALANMGASAHLVRTTKAGQVV